MKKKPINSTAQLAAHLGLSRWTVSRAINNHPGIGRATRDRVFAAMAQAGFTPSLLARGLRGGHTGLVGVCVQELENLHLVGKLTALQTSLRQRGLRMLVEPHDGESVSEEEVLRHFVAMHVAGVVLIASHQRKASLGLAQLTSAKIPYVLIDPFDSTAPYSVSVDRAHAMRLALQHLQSIGGRRMVALGIDPSAPYGVVRAAGIRETAADTVEFLFETETEQMDFHYGHRLAKKLAARRWCKTGIVALNDRVAIGAMRALLDSRRAVPQDAAIVGYDNMPAGEYFHPALTTLDPQPDLLVATASELLCRRIEGEDVPSEPRSIQAKLIVRESA